MMTTNRSTGCTPGEAIFVKVNPVWLTVFLLWKFFSLTIARATSCTWGFVATNESEWHVACSWVSSEWCEQSKEAEMTLGFITSQDILWEHFLRHVADFPASPNVVNYTISYMCLATFTRVEFLSFRKQPPKIVVFPTDHPPVNFQFTPVIDWRYRFGLESDRVFWSRTVRKCATRPSSRPELVVIVCFHFCCWFH